MGWRRVGARRLCLVALSVEVLFESKSLQEIDDDLFNFRQVLVQRGRRRIFSQCSLEAVSQVVGDMRELTCVDTNFVESLAGQVELSGKLDKDVRNLFLADLPVGPKGQGLEELFGGNQQLRDSGLNRIHSTLVCFSASRWGG